MSNKTNAPQGATHKKKVDSFNGNFLYYKQDGNDIYVFVEGAWHKSNGTLKSFDDRFEVLGAQA